MTKRELKAIENDETRNLIHSLYYENNGYGTIARALNERAIPTRTGLGTWNRTMVKRELAGVLKGVLKGTQECHATLH